MDIVIHRKSNSFSVRIKKYITELANDYWVETIAFCIGLGLIFAALIAIFSEN